MEHEQYKKSLVDRQKEDMVNINLNQMNDKRQREEMMRRAEREEQGTNPAHLGNGYRQQLAFMQEAERLNNISLKHYHDRIATQNAEKSM